MDGVVHISPNMVSKTFAEYAEVVFIPCMFFWNWENPTRGSRLGCGHEGQSETFNEGKQRDRNTQGSI